MGYQRIIEIPKPGHPTSTAGHQEKRVPGRRAGSDTALVTFITNCLQIRKGMLMYRYQCLECAYIYDPAKGDPTQQIPPGTPFEKLPPTWRCPECKISIMKHGVFRRLDT